MMEDKEKKDLMRSYSMQERGAEDGQKIVDLYTKLKLDGFECLYSKHEEGLAAFNQEAYCSNISQIKWKVGSKMPFPINPFLQSKTKDYVLVVSDTHDDVVAMEFVIKVANYMGIKHMIHAGDIVHNNMLATFADFRGRIFGVLGNHDRLNAAHYIYEHPQTDLKWDINRFSIYGKRFVLTHGESIQEMGRIVEEENPDFFIYGHWHAPAFFLKGNNAVINPGMFTTAEPVFLLLNINNPMESIYVKLEARTGTEQLMNGNIESLNGTADIITFSLPAQ